MRAHHIAAVTAAILVGVGMKLIFFTGPTAGANSVLIRSAGVDISRFHLNAKNLPALNFHDTSLVFPGED